MGSQAPLSSRVFFVEEKWKYIKNYKKLYQISNLGNVRNKLKDKKINKDSKGYCRVTLSKNDKKKMFLVHRLVAIHFIKNPKNKLYINHIDNNPSNNKIWNLEWCTAYENTHHTINQGRRTGINLSKKDVKKIRSLYKQNQSEIAKKFRISRESVNAILKQRTWKKL